MTTTIAEIKAAVREVIAETSGEQLFTIAETARKLGKSYNTICRMIAQNRLAATIDGKYVSQRAIDQYINAR